MEVAQELNYCNRCGANLNVAANLVPQLPAQPLRLTGPTIALTAMVVFSIAAIFSGADRLTMRGMPPLAITWICIVGMAMVFAVSSMVIRLWMTILKNSQNWNVQQPAQLKKPPPQPQLQSPQTGPMNVPLGSVTENTTRTFDPVYREKR